MLSLHRSQSTFTPQLVSYSSGAGCCVMHSRSANAMPHCESAACLLNCEVAPVGLSCFDAPLLGDVCVCVVRRVNMAPLVAFADCLSPTCSHTRLPTAHECNQTHLLRSPCSLTRFQLEKPFVHVDFCFLNYIIVCHVLIWVCFTKVAVIIAWICLLCKRFYKSK